MASKKITISLPEALNWKLSQLNKRSGIPKSTLISQAILLLVGEFESFTFPGGQVGKDYYMVDIEQEYAKREVADGKTS